MILRQPHSRGLDAFVHEIVLIPAVTSGASTALHVKEEAVFQIDVVLERGQIGYVTKVTFPFVRDLVACTFLNVLIVDAGQLEKALISEALVSSAIGWDAKNLNWLKNVGKDVRRFHGE